LTQTNKTNTLPPNAQQGKSEETMKTTEAAKIVSDYAKQRDLKALESGLNTVAFNARHAGSISMQSAEDIASDILAGRGCGSQANQRKIKRTAERILKAT
jgi:hypothetical protein